MKAEELRISNWVDLLIDGIHFTGGKITAIRDNGEIRTNDIVCSVEDLKPIFLTEEWLLKFSLEEIDEAHGLKYFWIDGSGLFSIRESKYSNRAFDAVVHSGVNSTIYLTPLDFVHEFQNWYYATFKIDLPLLK